jgi:hypothetical protein
MIATVIAQNALATGMPPLLMSSTLSAASLIAAGSAQGMISAQVSGLVEGVLKNMLMTKLKTIVAAVLIIAAIGVAAWGVGPPAAPVAMAAPAEGKVVDPPTLPPGDWASKLLAERFDEMQKLIKPQPGESRWREIPWQTSLWEARQLASAAGKPMFVWSGSGGAPCAPT